MFSFGNFSTPTSAAFGGSFNNGAGSTTSGFGGFDVGRGLNVGGSHSFNNGNNVFSGSTSQFGGTTSSYRSGFGGSRMGPDVGYCNGTTSFGMTRETGGSSVGGGVWGNKHDGGVFANFNVSR